MGYSSGGSSTIQQIIMNLMLNAIEAMKKTGGELTVKAQLNPEGWLVVSVGDTGVGLPEEWMVSSNEKDQKSSQHEKDF